MLVVFLANQQFAAFEKDAKALGLSLPPDVKQNQDALTKGMATYNKYLKNLNSIKL
jgi:hypothetical protein